MTMNYFRGDFEARSFQNNSAVPTLKVWRSTYTQSAASLARVAAAVVAAITLMVDGSWLMADTVTTNETTTVTQMTNMVPKTAHVKLPVNDGDPLELFVPYQAEHVLIVSNRFMVITITKDPPPPTTSSSSTTTSTTTTTIPPTQGLYAPTRVVVNGNTADIQWTDSVTGEVGWSVQRLSGTNWVNWFSVGANRTNATAYGLSAGSYSARVRPQKPDFSFHPPSDVLLFTVGGTTTVPTTTSTSTITIPASSAPSAATELTAVALSSSSVRLSWNHSGQSVEGFRVERTLNTNTWAGVASVPAGAREWIDTGLVPVTTYYYRVIATNSAANNASVPIATMSSLPTQLPGSVTVPIARPRIWWTSSRIAAARSTRFSPRSDEMTDLAASWVVFGNTNHARSAIARALGTVVSEAQLSGSSDTARTEGFKVCVVFDWCYNLLTDSERQMLTDRWNHYVSILSAQQWGGINRHEGNNYFWGYLQNEILWGIASMHDNSAAPTHLAFGIETRYRDSWIPYSESDALGKGGVPHEGNAYGSVNLAYAVIPFETARNLSVDLWAESEWWNDAVAYVIHATTPARTPLGYHELFQFNDDSMSGQHFLNNRTYHGDFMRTAAARGNAQAAEWITRVNPKQTPWIVASLPLTPIPASPLPRFHYSPSLGLLCARTDWTTNAVAVQIEGLEPKRVGHEARNAGTWQMVRGGQWISRRKGTNKSITGDNPAYQGGTASDAFPEAHNALLIGNIASMGVLESRGMNRGQRAGGGKVVATDFQSTHAGLTVDVTGLYKSNSHALFDNRFFTRATRAFRFEYATGELTITDTVDAPATVTATFVAHCDVNPPRFDILDAVTRQPITPTRVVNEGPNGQFRFHYDWAAPGSRAFIVRPK